jgi:hypothetical protein
MMKNLGCRAACGSQVNIAGLTHDWQQPGAAGKALFDLGMLQAIRKPMKSISRVDLRCHVFSGAFAKAKTPMKKGDALKGLEPMVLL